MKKSNHFKLNKTGLWKIIFGGVLIVPSTSFVASAQTQVLNPCPRIYYEEPFNSTRVAPQGCPPNAATRLLGDRANGITPTEPGANLTPNAVVPAAAPTTPAQIAPTPGQPGIAIDGRTPRATNPPGTPTIPVRPPLPENRSQAVAIVMPMDGNVDVKVKNNTNAIVTYEAIGHTPRRVLQGGEETVLRLPLPVTVTFVRQDNGFVKVMPMSASKKGMLEVGLNEKANPVDNNQGVLRIQKDGKVFLN